MNNFFYDLNKRLATLADKQDAAQLAESKQADHVAQSPLTQALNEAKADTIYVQHSNGAPQKVKLTPDMKAAGKIYVQHPSGPQTKVKIPADAKKSVKEEELDEAGYSAKAARAGKDIGKPGKNFEKIAKSAGAKYGSKAAGERVAGAVLNKLRHPKEDIENEGNAFTGKLKATPKGGKFKVGGKEFKDTSEIEEGFADMDAWLAQREKEKGTGKFDRKERTLPGGMKATTYTRKHEDDKEDDSDAPEAKGGAPKKKGRPKGPAKGPERVTKGAWKHKGKRKEKADEALDSDGVMMTRPSNMSSEGIGHGEEGEYNDEAGMAKDSLHTIVRHAKELEKALRSNENLPEWVQEKIGQIKGMMSSVTDYIISTHERDIEQDTGEEGITIEPVAEKAVSKAQRKFMGMAHAIQKGEKIKGASPALKKVAKKMKPSDTHDFAVTKEKGLPKKVKKTEEGAKPDFLDVDKDGNKKETFKKAVKDKAEKKVDETTTSGSVAPVANAAPKGKGGMQFGKGVYESLDKQFNQVLAEGMNVTINMSTNDQGEPTKSITVTAEGNDADVLAQLLKAAGVEQHAEPCAQCGSSSCGCEEELDENSPDWPTDTETLDADPELRTYSGGLNGPKSTGQSTTVGGGIPNAQARRQVSMEESIKLERNLFNVWKNYKG